MRILLADDNNEIRSALRLLLDEVTAHPSGQSTMDYRVQEAIDAETTLSQLTREPADMVLLDWELPGLASDRLILAIRAACPHCMVVAMSGRPEAGRLSIESGADAFISKSDPPDRLLALLRKSRGQVDRSDDGHQTAQMSVSANHAEACAADDPRE